MHEPLLKDIDAVVIGVTDLAAARRFYAEGLGLREVWSDASAAGLAVGPGGTEVVLHAAPDVPPGPSVHYLVIEVPAAVERLQALGARLVAGPFPIPVGRCAVLEDPLGHRLSIVDLSSAPRALPDPPAGSPVSLREITAESVRDVCRLQVGLHQRGFVAPNAVSIAQAHFSPHAWFRAVHAGEVAVGFMMLHDEPAKPEYFLWRFMIAASHQGKGFGKQALDLLVAHVRTRPGARELLTSYVPGPGSPGPFYLKAGFEETGREDEGERVLRMPL